MLRKSDQVVSLFDFRVRSSQFCLTNWQMTEVYLRFRSLLLIIVSEQYDRGRFVLIQRTALKAAHSKGKGALILTCIICCEAMHKAVCINIV